MISLQRSGLAGKTLLLKKTPPQLKICDWVGFKASPLALNETDSMTVPCTALTLIILKMKQSPCHVIEGYGGCG